MKMQLGQAGQLVIIGVDDSQTSENAFHVYAQNIHRPDDIVLVVHSIVVHSPHLYNSIFVRPEIERAEFEKERFRTKNIEIKYKHLLEKYQMNSDYLCMAGEPGTTLCKLASKYKAQQIVLGSHDKGKMARTLLGSISHYVTRHASCKVIAVKKTEKASG